MLMVAFMNNLPELLMWGSSMGVAFWLGRRTERWWTRK